jgi:hypothetical protein
MDNSRRKILATGLATLGSLFAIKAKATPSDKKIKVLTRDGKTIEIPEGKVRKKGSRNAGTDDVKNWIKTNRS